MNEELAERLARYLAKTLGAPDLVVERLSRIPGGASRETYRFRARYALAGERIERALILRRDPPASLIETDRATEFRAYQAAHAMGLPVPEPIVLEEGSAALERPFFIMAEIENCQTANILQPNPYGAYAAKIGEQFFRVLGEIARADPHAIGLGDLNGAKDARDCWRHELARWTREIEQDEREPQPIVRAALRWLAKNPPPPAQKISLLHGDYRTGNFLYDRDGIIRGILDWEMAHLGDPLEDLAWALDPLWSHGDPARPAGTIARADAIAIWQTASGLKFDADTFRWWEIFASMKGAAIWISGAREYAEGRNTDPVNAFSGWYCLAFHNKVLADRLSELVAT